MAENHKEQNEKPHKTTFDGEIKKKGAGVDMGKAGVIINPMPRSDRPRRVQIR